MMDLNGEKYFVTSLASPKLGWQYYNISDYYRLFAFIHNLDILYSLVLLAILVVIGIIASHFSVSLVKPIVKLSSQIESIKKNDDPVRALSEEGRKKIKKRDDEIGRLELEFASMTRQLGELIHENYEQKNPPSECAAVGAALQADPPISSTTRWIPSAGWLRRRNTGRFRGW
ncbi:MAG: hypothetical protein V8S98_03030 [Lachnospiraceae bacterium]